MSTETRAEDNVIVDERPWHKELPNIDYDNKAFWDGLRQHKLLLFRCKTCGAWYWPKAYCRNHENDYRMENLAWEEASGRGKVFAFNLVYRALQPAFADDVPYANVIVELDEGPLVSSTIVQADPEQTFIGMPVEVIFEDHPNEAFTLPRFRPAAD